MRKQILVDFGVWRACALEDTIQIGDKIFRVVGKHADSRGERSLMWILEVVPEEPLPEWLEDSLPGPVVSMEACNEKPTS